MSMEVNVSTKCEIKAVMSSPFGGYNYFEGNVRNGNRYARVSYSFTGNNKLDILVTYWEDGKSVAVDFASHCSTVNGIANKVSKFLNVRQTVTNYARDSLELGTEFTKLTHMS